MTAKKLIVALQTVVDEFGDDIVAYVYNEGDYPEYRQFSSIVLCEHDDLPPDGEGMVFISLGEI